MIRRSRLTQFLILPLLCGGLLLVQCKSKSVNTASSDITTPFTNDTSFDMSVTDIACNAEDNICILLDSVFDDSRCPTGVQCIWEGNAITRFKLTTNEGTVQFQLDTQPTSNLYQHDTTIAGYLISLVSLRPYPHADSVIKLTDYKATILVQPAG